MSRGTWNFRISPSKLRMFVFALAALLVFAAPSTSQQVTQGAAVRRGLGQEVRALWVVRTTLTSPERIRAMSEAAAANGFNTLIVQVRGRGDAYYRSRWEPRATTLKDQPADFDPLAVTLREAKKHGLKVHAWLNTSLLANLNDLPADPKHVYNAHPEWLAVPRAVAKELYAMSPQDPQFRAKIVEWSKANTAELEGVYVSPSNPLVRRHIVRLWLDVLAKYKVDGLHFDYVRLASPDFDYGRTSLDSFRRYLSRRHREVLRRDVTRELKANPLALAEKYEKEFADFQREQITGMVAQVYRAVKSRRRSAVVSAAVFGNAENAFTRRFQDWREWLRLGILDVVCPMAYSPDTEVFRKQIEIAAGAAHGARRRVWAGIGAYRIVPDSTIEKINAARSFRADGIILFSYDFAITKGPLNPEGDYLERVKKGAFEK